VAILEVQNVSKSFGGVRAVSEVTFVLNEGEILGLIGPNGAGKSTLFNLISGTDKPQSGVIRFDGSDITRLPPDEICRHIEYPLSVHNHHGLR
jgi:branched-chain amino acid transport system ATP-binding protein